MDGVDLRRAPNFVQRLPIAWELYLPSTEFTALDPIVALIRACYIYFLDHPPVVTEVGGTAVLNLPHATFVEESGIPNIAISIQDNPENIIVCVAIAACEILYSANASQLRKINVRFSGFGPATPIRSLKSHQIGKLISVRGTVVRVSAIKPLVVAMDFVCARCGGVMGRRFEDGKYSPPHTCETSGCRSKNFEPDRNSALTVDWQKVRIQEILSDDTYEPGRIPRTVEAELTEDLVDQCVPGDIVTLTGVVKVVSTEATGKGGMSKGKGKALFFLYIDCNYISNSKQSSGEIDILQYTLKDMYMIQDIANQENLFSLIVNSICPAIYGHEVVKAGWILALFGGNQKYSNDKNRIAIRGDPHVLVVGDPGLGKSQMLRAVANVAPRGVYVCGNTTTTSGLTVTLIKDGITGDYALEAGALVLADQGACCIDEFDKMGQEHQALMEAMEQQSVSIAKAGIVANLPARTSVLAAANPVGGHYNKAKTISENLKLNPALLSRFDLLFILLDKPDRELDQRLSEHVMSLHGGGRRTSRQSREVMGPPVGVDGALEPTLQDRLRLRTKDFDPIPPVLLRKYIGYARKYVQPKMTPGAAHLLQDFYLRLRRQHQSSEATPITTRQLEALIRLAEARAKLELRETITEADAKDVVEVMKASLTDVNTDETGVLDFQRSSGVSKRGDVKRYVAELHRVAEQTCNSLFNMNQLYKVATDMRLDISGFRDMISKLNNQGYLLKKRNNVFQLQTSSVAAGGYTPDI